MPNDSSNSVLSNLLQFVGVLNRQTDYDEILRLVSLKAIDVLDSEYALILMINPSTLETVKTVMRQGSKFSAPGMDSAQRQITGWMMEEQSAFISEDIKNDRRFFKLDSIEFPVKSAIAVLLEVENLTLGSIVVFRGAKAEPFAEADLTMLQHIALISAPYLRNIEKIREFFKPALPESSLLRKYADASLIGASKNFLKLLLAIEAAARCDVGVVLEGETGTGKELIAKAIHRFSNRNGRPFIAVDCGAIPKHLLESELFGYKKGAFTGATQDRKGLIEEADGGTLFIDEVANLPLEMQAKFMRFLQEGEIRPVGANLPKTVNVRIIAAASQSLRKLVEDGKFREDMFYRLYIYPIYLPPLREREKDINLLADFFLEKYSQQQGKNIKSFHPDLRRFMRQRPWKGNIRELENFVRRLATLAAPEAKVLNHKIIPADLKDEYHQFTFKQRAVGTGKSLSEHLQDYEEQVIRQALIENNWNQSKAARSLKISEAMVRYRMKKLGITRKKS